MQTLTSLPSYLAASNAPGTAVLEATTAWCPQCKAFAPALEKLARKFPDARFYSYDADEADDIAHELGATMMPTFHVFQDGEVKGSVTGVKAKALEDAIRGAYEGRIVEDGEGEEEEEAEE